MFVGIYLIFFKGIPTYLLINATDLTFPGRINKLELVNLRGDILMEIPIQYYASRPFLYNVSSFIPPQDFYYLKVRLFSFHIFQKFINT